MIDAQMTGRCGADADLKFTAAGLPYVSFVLAVDVGKGADGQPATEWVRVSFFGGAAVDLAPKLGRGDEVEVSGKLTVGRWTAGDGTAKAGLNCLANYVNPRSRQRATPTRTRDMVSRVGFGPARTLPPRSAPSTAEFDGEPNDLPF